METLIVYKQSFLQKRRNYMGTYEGRKNLDHNRTEWVEKAAKKMSQATLDQYIVQINRETCNSSNALLEISRDL